MISAINFYNPKATKKNIKIQPAFAQNNNDKKSNNSKKIAGIGILGLLGLCAGEYFSNIITDKLSDKDILVDTSDINKDLKEINDDLADLSKNGLEDIKEIKAELTAEAKNAVKNVVKNIK